MSLENSPHALIIASMISWNKWGVLNVCLEKLISALKNYRCLESDTSVLKNTGSRRFSKIGKLFFKTSSFQDVYVSWKITMFLDCTLPRRFEPIIKQEAQDTLSRRLFKPFLHPIKTLLHTIKRPYQDVISRHFYTLSRRHFKTLLHLIWTVRHSDVLARSSELRVHSWRVGHRFKSQRCQKWNFSSFNIMTKKQHGGRDLRN